MNSVKFVNTIVFVEDLQRSRKFYEEVLMQKMVKEFGVIIFYENHLVLHEIKPIMETVYKTPFEPNASPLGRRNILVYFETEDLQAMFDRVSGSGAKIIHNIEAQAWGQKVFRFYDPDEHIVEIGEPFEG